MRKGRAALFALLAIGVYKVGAISAFLMGVAVGAAGVWFLR